MKKKPKFLLRLFSNNLYAEEFITQGHLYMNTLNYFRNMENSFQGDRSEGDVLNGNGGATLHWSKDGNFDSTSNIQITSIPTDGLVYCFFEIYEEQLKIEDDSLQWFGECCNMLTAMQKYQQENGAAIIVLLEYDAIIIKTQEVLKEVLGDKFPFIIDSVKYCEVSCAEKFQALVDKDLLTLVFTKPESYAYQQELRVFIHCKPSEECPHADVYLGDLSPYILLYGQYQPQKEV